MTDTLQSATARKGIEAPSNTWVLGPARVYIPLHLRFSRFSQRTCTPNTEATLLATSVVKGRIYVMHATQP